MHALVLYLVIISCYQRHYCIHNFKTDRTQLCLVTHTVSLSSSSQMKKVTKLRLIIQWSQYIDSIELFYQRDLYSQ